MRTVLVGMLMLCVFPSSVTFLQAQKGAADDYSTLLDRLRRDNAGEYEKVKPLAEKDSAAALQFLQNRYSGKSDKPAPDKPATGKTPKPSADKSPLKTPIPGDAKKAAAHIDPLPARRERFTVIESLPVGEFVVDLCRRDDGVFGLGEIRHGRMLLRRADFLITWQVDGKFPTLHQRAGNIIWLVDPKARLAITTES